MSAPENSQHLDDADEWSLPSIARTSSDVPWATVDAYREWSQEIPVPPPLPSLRGTNSTACASLPTELYEDDALPWTPDDENQRNSVFSGASPSLDGYLSHDRQTSPRRVSMRQASMQVAAELGAREGSSGTMSDLPPDAPGEMPATTPDSMPEHATEPNYLSDSQLYPDVAQHRRHASASSVRLRTLPSLRRGETGRRRPALERKRNNVMKQALSRGTVAPGQPSKVWRVRDGKFHQMEWKGPASLEGQAAVERDVQVTAWCLGMGINLPELYKVLVERFGEEKVTVYPRPPEHMHPARVSREFAKGVLAVKSSLENADHVAMQEAVAEANIIHLYYSDPNGHPRGEVVYAEYGSVVTWGIPIDLHSEVVFNLVGKFLEDPKDYGAIQADSMKVQVMEGDVKPTIRNDTMLLHHELFDQLEVRVGMSLALAQSTRLSMQEELTMRIIARTKNYPALLVQHGHVHIDEDDLSKTIGSVFLEKTELNLQVLSGPYNFPKFFTSCPDHVQKLYALVSDNFNLDDRAEILNRRFSTLTDMLDLLRDQQTAAHEEHLSRIVIFLIFSTMCLGMLQILTTIFGARFGVLLDIFFGW